MNGKYDGMRWMNGITRYVIKKEAICFFFYYQSFSEPLSKKLSKRELLDFSCILL